MAETTTRHSGWQLGYEAALRDLEQLAADLRARGQEPSLERLLAELRAGLAAGRAVDPDARETSGVPPEDLQREWTEG